MAVPGFVFGSSNVSRGVQYDILAQRGQQRLTLPSYTSLPSAPQMKGSLIYNQFDNKVYFSDGDNWIEVISSLNGAPIRIMDTDSDTIVSTDTIPETDSDRIYFTTAGTLRSVFTPAGVFVATAGAVNPTTIVPAVGKVAHFEGDITVTGVIDPTGVQIEEGAVRPVNPTGSSTGLVWVRDDNPNVLMFTDNAGTNFNISTPVASQTLAATLVAGNSTGGTDIVVTSGDAITSTGSLSLESSSIAADSVAITTAGGIDVNYSGTGNVVLTSGGTDVLTLGTTLAPNVNVNSGNVVFTNAAKGLVAAPADGTIVANAVTTNGITGSITDSAVIAATTSRVTIVVSNSAVKIGSQVFIQVVNGAAGLISAPLATSVSGIGAGTYNLDVYNSGVAGTTVAPSYLYFIVNPV